MKKIIYLATVILLVACEAPIVEKIDSTYPDDTPEKVSYYQEQNGQEVKVEEKHYHINGKLKMTGKFLNGKRDGEWFAYFDNDQLQSLGTFKQGKRTGGAKVYYSNGKVRYEGQYENNKEVGVWKFYNEEGKLTEEKEFK